MKILLKINVFVNQLTSLTANKNLLLDFPSSKPTDKARVTLV